MYPGGAESKGSGRQLKGSCAALQWRVVSAVGRFCLGVFAMAAIGCASAPPPPPSEPVATPHAAAAAAAVAPAYDVPAMSTFSVALLRPMGTRLSAPGDSFRAKVISPLTTLRGYPIVPVGSLLQGRVVAVE